MTTLDTTPLLDEHARELERLGAIVFSSNPEHGFYTVIASRTTGVEDLVNAFVGYLGERTSEDVHYGSVRAQRIENQPFNGVIHTGTVEPGNDLSPEHLLFGVTTNASKYLHPPARFSRHGFGGSGGSIAHSATLFTLPHDYVRKEEMRSLLAEYAEQMTGRTSD